MAAAVGQIAFGRDVEGVDGAVTWLTDASGRSTHQLLPGHHELATWSPSGDLIAITADLNGRVIPALIRPDGTGYREIPPPDPNLNLGCSAWSPDGLRLACEAWDETNPARNGIVTVRASDGGDPQQVTVNPDGEHDIPDGYSPDGTQIVFGRPDPTHNWDTHIFVVRLDGSEPRPLGGDFLEAPSWSPDGDTLIGTWGGQLLQVDPRDGSRLPIIVDGGEGLWCYLAHWSPDGEWLVFSGARPNEQFDIYRVRPDGTGLFQITSDPDNEEGATWSPTG